MYSTALSESPFTIDKNGVANPVSSDRVIKTPQVRKKKKPTAGLHNTTG